MEQQGSSAGSTNTPSLCVNNCGFYGSPATNNLCSVCFKKQQKSNHDVNFRALVKPNSTTSAATTSVETTKSHINSGITDDNYAASKAIINTICGSFKSEINVSMDKVNADPTEIKPELSIPDNNTIKKKPIRCLTCNKRLTTCPFKCRCGDLFCGEHRYSDKHNCTFDYKAKAKDAIAKANPVIKADKVCKI